MICNTKQEALARCNKLVHMAMTSTDVMQEIIKLELKDHIINWGISKQEFLALEAAE
jgi:adenylosuccinate lyase